MNNRFFSMLFAVTMIASFPTFGQGSRRGIIRSSVKVAVNPAVENNFYRDVREDGSIEAYQEYLSRYPKGRFATKARKQLEKLYYQQAIELDDIDYYREYLQNYPNGAYTQDVKKRIESHYYEFVMQQGTKELYEQFLETFPKSQYCSKVKEKLEDLYFQDALATDTREGFEKFITQYPNGSNTAKARAALDKIDYQKACNTNTVEAYMAYLAIHPNGSYVNDVNQRIADYQLFQNAKISGTADGWKEYLTKSKYQCFHDVAQQEYDRLAALEQWEVIKNSEDINTVQSFLKNYPNSEVSQDANQLSNLLLAQKAVEHSDYQRAVDLFNQAGGRNKIPQKYVASYDLAMEHVTYRSLSEQSSVSELEAFLRQYPNSQYKNSVSNYLGLNLSQSFDQYSTEQTYSYALNYATDKPTRELIKQYIAQNRAIKKAEQRAHKRARVKADGGYFLFGFSYLDAGWNFPTTDKYVDMGYYNIGVSVKIGNYRTPLQFEVGAQPGILTWKPVGEPFSVEDDSGESKLNLKTQFHMPLFAKLKLNLFPVSSSRLYLAGQGWFNAIRDKALESEYAVGGGIGFAWRHADWYLIYYKQDFDPDKYFKTKYIGTQLIYYF